jgi:hypothetical protein
MRGHEFVQDGGQLVQAVQVRPRELLQDLLAVGGQADPHHPAVVGVRDPLHQSGGLGPVHQFHRTVRAQQQVAGQVPDRRGLAARGSLNRHQQLVLDVGQPGRLGLVLAPALKAPQCDPEFQQPLEISLGKPAHGHLPDLVDALCLTELSRYDIKVHKVVRT